MYSYRRFPFDGDVTIHAMQCAVYKNICCSVISAIVLLCATHRIYRTRLANRPVCGCRPATQILTEQSRCQAVRLQTNFPPLQLYDVGNINVTKYRLLAELPGVAHEKKQPLDESMIPSTTRCTLSNFGRAMPKAVMDTTSCTQHHVSRPFLRSVRTVRRKLCIRLT